MSNKIRFYRVQSGLKQIEIAEKLFISQNTYSKYENNPDFFNASQLKTLAKLFNVKVDDLINDDKIIISDNNQVVVNGEYFNYNDNNLIELLLKSKDDYISHLLDEIEKLKSNNFNIIG